MFKRDWCDGAVGPVVEALEGRWMLAGSATLGADGTLLVRGTKHGDEILIWSGTLANVPDGSTHVMINGSESVFQAGANVKRIVVEAGRGDDYVRLSPGVHMRYPPVPPGGPIPLFFIPSAELPATLLGGQGDDTLMGGSASDSLHGGGGSDALDGVAGNDIVRGGANSDHVVGGAGDDHMSGGPGDDALDGYAGNDTLSGDAGRDSVRGMEGEDQMGGGAGDQDSIFGNEGKDVFFWSGDAAEERKDRADDEPFLALMTAVGRG